jgi:dienelactone hydrolase
MTPPIAATSVTPRPFFFGAADRRLFGCFHPPSAEVPRPMSVLISGPCGHEYIAAHRALRQLAVRLAQAGFATLRFDWYGLGDSAGASDAGTLAHWKQDLAAARAELGQLAGGSALAMIGVRLGAALALDAARTPSEPLVLWDPILKGQAWIAELRAISGEADARDEPMNIGLSPRLRDELEQLDLAGALPTPPADLLLVPGAAARADSAALVEQLSARGTRADCREASYPPGWLERGSAVVPASAIQAITRWLSDRVL